MNKPPPDGNRDIAPIMASPTETMNFVSPESQWRLKETVMVILKSFAEEQGLGDLKDSSLNTWLRNSRFFFPPQNLFFKARSLGVRFSCKARKPRTLVGYLYPVSLSVFTLTPDLSFDRLRVLVLRKNMCRFAV